ncbi:sensor histidine kinase [Marinomonas spartinae]|uniref:sensor histidine kinase n=1 Tax=Marinomonas spartinae TaxID=1792290 RepID=UPI0018F1FE08|nr:HAMP domain-containing sensor histidine kinase [Marinomonas spartinae]MBJ7554695.1 HAMP domain-containing histidine kinase [Marinomonas spartinae]
MGMNDVETKNEFYHVMDASIQDMKNSLNLLQHTLEKMPTDDKGISLDEVEAKTLHYEVTRLQNSTEQLYSLYLLENDKLSLQLKEVYILELIEERMISHAALLSRFNVQVDFDIDEQIYVYSDPAMLSQVLDIALVNAARYTNNRIYIKVSPVENGAIITVEDNGQGYPDFVLEDFSNVINEKELANLTNQMLAWYFCHSIAHMHHSKKVKGWVKLDNDGQLGGSRFQIFIP